MSDYIDTGEVLESATVLRDIWYEPHKYDRSSKWLEDVEAQIKHLMNTLDLEIPE